MEDYLVTLLRKGWSENLRQIEEAINALYAGAEEEKDSRTADVLEAIRQAIARKEQIFVPVDLPQPAMDAITAGEIQVGNLVDIPPDTRLHIRVLQLKNGPAAYAAFTSREENSKGEASSAVTEDIACYLEKALLSPEVDGVVINPWDKSFFLSKSMIKLLFAYCLPEERENTVCIDVSDITQAETECIVNAANHSLLGGGGVDGAIHRAAGPELLEACRALHGCKTGEAKLTKGYNLKADYIIHTVGPVYSGSEEDARLLGRCYWNCLELARKTGIHSIAFPAISTGAYGYPLKEAAEVALSTVASWLKANPGYWMAILFACFKEETADIYRAVWDRIEENWNDRPIIRENNGTVEKALRYAAGRCEDAPEKEERPGILRPVETLQILSVMDADINLLAAGLLRSLPEKAAAPLLDIYENFGTDVAALVNAFTLEGQPWYLRRLWEIRKLPQADIRLKMLFLAEKTAELRRLDAGYRRQGEALWAQSNIPKEYLSWYYSGILDGLADLQQYVETETAYWEMTRLYKDLFVTFLADEQKGLLYQLSAHGENMALKKGRPQWNPLEGGVSGGARPLPRKEAERMEDNWAEPFWEAIGRDLSDGEYGLTAPDGSQSAGIRLCGGRLSFLAGEGAPGGFCLDEENTRRFLAQLRLRHPLRHKLGTILQNEFGDGGLEKIRAFCTEHGICCQPSGS